VPRAFVAAPHCLQVPGARLALVGDGPQRGELEQLLAGMPVKFMVSGRATCACWCVCLCVCVCGRLSVVQRANTATFPPVLASCLVTCTAPTTVMRHTPGHDEGP
jgi:hypothetical protein